MPDSKIITRLKALEALRIGAKTESEAAVAALRIKEILNKYNLEANVLEVPEEQNAVELEPEVEWGRDLSPSDAILASATDLMMDTLHFIADHGWTSPATGKKVKAERRLIFVGLKANVEASCLTFIYLRECVAGLLKKRQTTGDIYGKRECSSYRLGAARRIYTTCAALKKQPESSECKALVVLGNAVAQRHLDAMQFEDEYAPDIDPKDALAASLGYVDGKTVDPRRARSKRLEHAESGDLFG